MLEPLKKFNLLPVVSLECFILVGLMIMGCLWLPPSRFSLILVEPLKFKKDISHFKPLISHIGIDIYIPLLYIYIVCTWVFTV